MEIRSGEYYDKDGKRHETKEIYFDLDEIEITLNAEKISLMDIGEECEECEEDYRRIEIDKDNPFFSLTKLFALAKQYVEQGWEDVNIRIETKGNYHFVFSIQNSKMKPVWACMVVSIEDINKDCAEKLKAIKEILNKKEVIK